MNPKEVAIYKVLVAIQHLIEDVRSCSDDEDDNYEYFRFTLNATREGIERLMRDIGRRHLIEADFINNCDSL